MYKFCTTERNNAKANEFETKSMLYLLSYRKDSEEIDTFFVDCFNDVTGSNTDATKLWDVQSKNVNSLNPTKIGTALITLFLNYISNIDFAHYILVMPKLKEMYLLDEALFTYSLENFTMKHKEKIIEGLKKEFLRRNKKSANQTEIEEFLKSIHFVIATEDKIEFVKKIVKFNNIVTIEDKFFGHIFDEIRDMQTKLKNIDIEGKSIEFAREALLFEKVIHRSEIEILIINRFLGVDLFSNRMVPNLFIEEIKDYDIEERKNIIQECNADLSKVIFDKNNKKQFWMFFGDTISLLRENSEKTPRQIYKELKKIKVKIPVLLEKLSVIYLISILKESFENDN